MTHLSDAAARFAHEGYVHLPGLLDADQLASMAELHERIVVEPTAAFYGGFDRLDYDSANEDRALLDLLASPALRSRLAAPLGQPFVFTQAIALELTAARTGFPWHFGAQSFNYIFPEDAAATLWIPLDPIDPAGQDGGMVWVPRHIWSAAEHYKLFQSLIALPRPVSKHIDLPSQYSVAPGVGPADERFLEHFKMSLRFEPGDALLFHKDLWHRSTALREGPLTRRRAFSLRFVDHRARYAKTNMTHLDLVQSKVFGGVPSRYGHGFTDIDDGQPLADSAFFGEPMV